MIELEVELRRGDLDLSVQARLETPSTGLLGPSGAGKSSLLLALAGLLPGARVRLSVQGEVLAEGDGPPAHRRRVGLVFQEHRLFPHRSVEANLRYGHDAGGQGPSFDEVVDLLEIGALLPRRPGRCSGGERQRVALGRALLAAPRLLLLDEPMASLDPGLRGQILPYLRRVREGLGMPLLTVSHDLGDLLALTDELLLLERGALVGQGSLGELATRPECLERLHAGGLVFALPGRIARRDEDGLAWVAAEGEAGHTLACGRAHGEVGARVDVVLRPADVMLARPPLEARLSVLNRLPGRVVHIAAGATRRVVTVDCGLAVPLLAELTERAVRQLELAPGVEVVALFKAQATRARDS